MEFKDTGTLELKAQTSEFDKQLKELNDNAKTLKATLKEIEATGGKGSEQWKKYKDELKATTKEAETLAKSLKGMDVAKMTISQLEQHSKALNKELKQLAPGTKAFIDTAKRLGEVDKQMGAVKTQVDGIKKSGEDLAKPTMWDKITGGFNKVKMAMSAMVVVQVLQWAVDLGKAIFGVTQKMEKYETVLKVALGSQKLAKDSMKALQDIAAKTPFSVDQLTEAYVKMVNRGLRPTREQIIAMGDVASALGKPMDQLNEAILDVSNTKRWQELGISVQKSGDKIIGSWKGQKITMDATEEGALKMVQAFGQMNGVAGMNAEMMNKLEGKTSNLGDTFLQLAAQVGENLKPLFYGLLAVIVELASFALELAKNAAPVVTVFKNLWIQCESLFDSLSGLVYTIFPGLKSQTVSASGVMKGLAIAFQTMLLPIKLAMTGIQLTTDAIATMLNTGKALVMFLKGDFTGASSAWEATKTQATSTAKHVLGNFKSIKDGYKNAMIDTPKALEPEAVLAAATTEGKKQKAMSDEQKKAADKAAKEAEKNRKKEEKAEDKHLDEIEKANEEAIEKIAEYEAEANINSIRDELKREIAKIDEKARKRTVEVNATKADCIYKEKQISAIEKEAEAERQKVSDEFKAKEEKKQQEAAQKRLETQKYISDQERKAESALLDWKEVAAGTNARKLTEVKKERLELELKYTKEKLDNELAIEKAKAETEIKDADQKAAALKAIKDKYDNENKASSAKTAAAIDKIDKDLTDGKVSKQKAWTDVFSNFLKGDVSKAVEAAGHIVEGEKKEWQKRLAKNEETYKQIGEVAIQAANFIANVEKAKADQAIAQAMRERDEKVAILQQQLDKNSADLNAAIDNERSVKEEQSAKLKDMKASETERIKNMEEILKDDTMDKADKIKAMKENYSAAFLEMKDAETERVKAMKEAETEKLQNLEQTLNENIWDLESELRATTDKAEKAALEEKIRKAKHEKDEKMDAAEKTMKAAIKAAEDERDAKIKAGADQLKARKDELDDETKQDKALSKERIEQAKDEMNDKIKAAEKEKEEKVKAAQDEKNRQIRIKKDLEAAIKAENDKAARVQREEKTKAWEAQKKADTAAAIITGALAMLKALASGLWPVNLVFAAMAGIMTGIQVAKINSQPKPQFHYGFTPEGSKHAAQYGKGGIALVDNKTGKDVGEMEGGEAIVNAEQTAINQPILKQMHENAKKGIKKPVWQTMKMKDRPMAFRDGVPSFRSPAFEGRMYQYGGTVGKPRFADGTDGYSMDGVSQSDAEVARSKEISEEQIRILREQNASLKRMVEQNDLSNYYTAQTRDAVNRNVDATRSVEGAIRQTSVNQKMDNLIGLISGLSFRVK